MLEKVKPPDEEIERIRRSFQAFYDAVSERDGEIRVNVIAQRETDEVVGFGFVTSPPLQAAKGRPTEFPGTLSNVLRYSED